MVRAILLDMDGVLIDSERHWHAIEGAWLRSVIPGWIDEYQKECVGLSMLGLYEMLCFRHELSMTYPDFQQAYMELAEAIYQERAELMPYCMDFLRAARESGTTLAVVSSSPKDWIQIIVDRFHIADYFSRLVSADDVGGIGKPDPAVYLHAAAQLSEDPSDCVAIEDSENGVLSAVRAGMQCVGFRNGLNDGQNLDRAHQIMKGFSEAAYYLLLKELRFSGNKQ
jgi:HAD superfamily hydrolase (TIGR01509 family)